MASSLNEVRLIGFLGSDPELKRTPQGLAVAAFSVATSEEWVDREGNKHEETEWHNIVVWNKAAENAAKYLTKGRQVHISGKIKTRSWDDKTTGKKVFRTEIIAQNILYLSNGGAQNGARPAQAEHNQEQAASTNPADIPF